MEKKSKMKEKYISFQPPCMKYLNYSCCQPFGRKLAKWIKKKERRRTRTKATSVHQTGRWPNESREQQLPAIRQECGQMKLGRRTRTVAVSNLTGRWPSGRRVNVTLSHCLTVYRYTFMNKHHSISNGQGTSEVPLYAFQEGQYKFRKSNTDSGGPLRIQEGQYRTVCAF